MPGVATGRIPCRGRILSRAGHAPRFKGNAPCGMLPRGAANWENVSCKGAVSRHHPKWQEVAMNRMFILAAGLVTALSMLAGPASAADAPAYDGPKLKFRVAHTTPPGNHITLAFEKFKDLVEQKSNGKIKVQVFPNAILGSDRVLMEGAQKGSLEMAVSSTPNMANFSPLYQVFDLPYITSPKNQEKLYKAIDSGALGEYFKKVANSIGLEPIMYAEYGYRNFVTINRPVSKVEDLAGLKMRTTDSAVEVEVAKILKMNPTPVAWGEVYTALQQGTVDGEGNTFPHMYGAKHHEVLKYAVTSAHNYGMQVMMANKAWWDKLPPAAQKVIREAAAEALAYQRTVLYPKNEAEAREGFIKAGIKIVDLDDAQLDAFRKATRPVWDKFKGTLPPELVDLVIETQK